MRSGKMLAAVATVVATLLGANSEIQAGGAGDLSATCVVHSPSGESLTGSAALTVHFIGGTTADSVEVTLALERQSSGNPQFFRRIITGTIQVLSPQGLACQVISQLQSEILTRFYGSDAGLTIKIADDSISETDGLHPLDSTQPSLQSSLAQVRLFVQAK